MKGYLLDTNIVSYFHDNLKSEHLFVMSRIRALDKGSLLLSSMITLGEMEDGLLRAPPETPEQLAKQTRLRRFVRNQFPQPLHVTEHTAEFYGLIRSRIYCHCYPESCKSPRKKPKPPKRPEEWIDHLTSKELKIEENDLWIAAQAAERNLTFVTHDGMANIKAVLNGLVDVEDWAV